MCACEPGPTGCSRAARRAVFPRRAARALACTVPRVFQRGTSSLEPSRPLRSVFTPAVRSTFPFEPLSSPPVGAPSLGSRVPLRGFHLQRPHPCERPSPHCVPSSAFLPPSTVCSAACLAGLFRPATAFRVPPFRGSFLRRSRTESPSACALVPFRRTSLRLPAPDRPPSTAGPCSPRESGFRAETVRSPRVPCPSWASPPPGAPHAMAAPSRHLRLRPSPRRTRHG